MYLYSVVCHLDGARTIFQVVDPSRCSLELPQPRTPTMTRDGFIDPATLLDLSSFGFKMARQASFAISFPVCKHCPPWTALL